MLVPLISFIILSGSVVPAFADSTFVLLCQKGGAAANDQLGFSVASAGDADGDGKADLIVGAPNASPGGHSAAGLAYVYDLASGLLNDPNLNSISVFEMTGSVFTHTFQKNDSKLATRVIQCPTPTPFPADFMGTGQEYYDIFVSNADGMLDSAGDYVTIECVHDTNFTGFGVGNNLDAVALNYTGGVIKYATCVASYVLGNGANPATLGEATNALGLPNAVPSYMGTQCSRITLGFAPSPNPHMILSSNDLSFSADQNGPLPSSQSFTINNTCITTLNWSVSDDQTWLDVSPISGNSNSQVVTVSVNTTNLPPGTYNATITVYSTNADNSPQTVAVNYVISPSYKTFILEDALNNPISNKSFRFSKVANDPPTMTESFLGDLTTDGNGKVTLPLGWFNEGDWVKVERNLKTERAVKHQALLPTMYRVKLDNGKFSSDGAISYNVLTSAAEQEVIVDHTTVLFNLLVSVEWDADQQYLQSLSDGFRMISNNLYDAFDGQLHLDTVFISDNKLDWYQADVLIYARNDLVPPKSDAGYPDKVLSGGIHEKPGAVDEPSSIHFPRILYSNDVNENINATESEYPYDWTRSAYNSMVYPAVRGFSHEFGHYGLGFRDEYKNSAGSYIFTDFNFGMMDEPLDGSSMTSEISSNLQYSDPSKQQTAQWHWRKKSCWDDFQKAFEGDYDGIFAPIKKPLNQPFIGPNNLPPPLNYDVGCLLNILVPTPSLNAKTVNVAVRFPLFVHWKVDLIKQDWPYLIEQGKTTAGTVGRIRCLGVTVGDAVSVNGTAYDVNRRQWLSGNITVAGVMFSNISSAANYAEDDSLSLSLKVAHGDFQAVASCSFATADQLNYGLTVNKLYQQDPILEVHPESAPPTRYGLTTLSSGYETSVGDSLHSTGLFSLVALDDSSDTFFVNTSYTVTHLPDSSHNLDISGPGASCELILDTLNSSFQKILIISSDFPPLQNGLGTPVEQGGAAQTICPFPNDVELNGPNNFLVLRYFDSDLQNNPETSLRIFRWNQNLGQWELMGSQVDTSRNEVTTQINTFGTYAAFSTCVAAKGDLNDDGLLTPSDVVLMLNCVFLGSGNCNACFSDVNCDGNLTPSEVVLELNRVFLGTPFPCE